MGVRGYGGPGGRGLQGYLAHKKPRVSGLGLVGVSGSGVMGDVGVRGDRVTSLLGPYGRGCFLQSGIVGVGG